MTLKDLLYSSVDGDLSSGLSKEDLLSIDIHVIEINDDVYISGSHFNRSKLFLDILL